MAYSTYIFLQWCPLTHIIAPLILFSPHTVEYNMSGCTFGHPYTAYTFFLSVYNAIFFIWTCHKRSLTPPADHEEVPLFLAMIRGQVSLGYCPWTCRHIGRCKSNCFWKYIDAETRKCKTLFYVSIIRSWKLIMDNTTKIMNNKCYSLLKMPTNIALGTDELE